MALNAAVLDTSAVIAFFQGLPRAADLVRSLDRLVLPSVAVGELLVGRRGPRAATGADRSVRELLSSRRVRVAVLGAGTAERYAAIVDALRDAGKPIPANNVWIAACAMELGLPVITTDKHFLSVPQVLVELLPNR